MADFVLGRIKFKWRGDWSTSTAFLIDDIVKYGGNTYVCLTNHTSAASTANFYTDLNSSVYWSLHTEGLFFKGPWQSSTFYKLNDLVKNGAYQYRCILQHTSAGSFAIGSNWQVFTEGLQWEDSYNAGTTYSDGDVVTYGGYTYVYVNDTPSSGNTPTDNSYWDVVTTGFKALGDYIHGTSYKTGETVQYGGNNYVAIANHSNQYPANTNGTTNSSYWTLNLEGFNYRASYSNVTTYNIGDVVLYEGSSYVQIKDRQLNVTPGTDATVWKVLAQGSETAVLAETGDMIVMNESLAASRLNLGPAGSILTSNGTLPEWRYDEGSRNVLYVSNSGNDSTGTGAKTLPFKTIKAALAVSGKGDILELSAVSGGSGGTGGVFTVSTFTTSGSGTGAVFQITIDGSSAPTLTNVIIVNGGKNFAAGDTVTITGSTQLGGATNMTLTILNVNFGDLIWVKTGSYREQLPLVVPANVCVRGEALRSVEVRPATGNSSTAATISFSSTITGASNGVYKYKHPVTSSGSGAGMVVNVTIAGSVVSATAIYHGGYNYATGNIVTLTAAQIGCGGTGTLSMQVDSLEANNASYMFLLNDGTNLRLMTLRGMTGTSTHLNANTDFGGAVLCSLDPEGAILTQSPYCQDMTSLNSNAVGIKIDGLLHTNAASNKSILGTHFTQINSDGIGIWCHGNGRAEMVSCFTYFCNKSYYASEGGFIRGLNGSSCYGEEGAVAEGSLVAETPVGVQGNGDMLNYNPLTFGGSATESDIDNSISANGSGTATILGLTSGATATLFRHNIALDFLHIKNRVGNFQKSETIRITKENSSQITVNLNATFGDASANIAQKGQVGPLIAVKSGTTSLTSSGLIKVGANIKFAGNSTYFRISLVSEENTVAGTATVRLTESITDFNGAVENNEVGNVTTKFSNVRLTGHDFLSIGTGGVVDTNYPGEPLQPADQADEVVETDGGRVYFVSTDQDGDFRVGDLFRIQQATGIATLNADAFDLSGLSELQLGSIGAQLGATINEFSTDETMGGNSNTAVPTEFAIVGYTQRDKMGTGHIVVPTGTTAERPTGGDLFEGGVRYNTSLDTWEGYNGTQWTGLGGGNPWSTITSDGSTAVAVAANDRVFVNTTAGPITITLPASPQTGDQISILDLASTFDTNNCTLNRNGNKIMGLTENLVLNVEDEAIQIVYTGATFGWKLTTNL
jgi:hypothetical protein